jgi:hypothetical protein
MTLSIVHSFRSAIPDDPVAVAAGEITPSNWNDNHTVGGTVPLAQIDMLPPLTVLGNAGSSTAPPTAVTDQQLAQLIGAGGTTDISTLQSQVATLQSTVSAQATQISALLVRIQALEAVAGVVANLEAATL